MPKSFRVQTFLRQILLIPNPESFQVSAFLIYLKWFRVLPCIGIPCIGYCVYFNDPKTIYRNDESTDISCGMMHLTVSEPSCDEVKAKGIL